MSLPHGTALCDGLPSRVRPSRPMHLCLDCERRLQPASHPWQKYINPAPARHEGGVWVCEKRITK